VKFGVYMFPTDYAISVVELGKALEERGFESLFVPEHTHIPSSRETPWPAGGELPLEYSHTLDPVVALSAVAAVTTRLQLGFGVCLVIQRDPIVLAKEVASLDHISGGRVLFGIGGGWNREEIANHGTDPARRWSVLRERVLAMKEIWTNEIASFSGEFVDFDKIWSWPKPVRQPPVLMGGNGAKTFERVLEYCDGWMPINRGKDEEFAARIAELQNLAAERGRPPVPVSLFAATPKPAALERYAELGLERVLFTMPPLPADEVLPKLDRLAELVAGAG
jgi:probable F420-dependent oxidoreductase